MKRSLTYPERRIIAARRIEGDTLQQIGDDFGVSRERIRQICDAEGVRPARERVPLRAYRRFFGAVAYAAKQEHKKTEPWHGTVQGYGYRGCRCAACTKAHADRHLAYSRARHPEWRPKKRWRWHEEPATTEAT